MTDSPSGSPDRPTASSRPFLLSGCSGGGKSTLLAELARRGFATFEEAGRQIVQAEIAAGGDALPWLDPERFVQKLRERAEAQYREASRSPAPAFLDRGVVEAFAWYWRMGRAVPPEAERAASDCRYAEPVFLAPPWQEIFIGDAERRHALDEAVAEYEALVEAFALLGYRTVVLPKTSVAARADFVLAEVSAFSPSERP